jgi:hypothetical protein
MGLLDATPLAGFFYDPTNDKRRAKQALEESDQSFRDLVTPDYTPVDYTGPEEARDIRVDPIAVERAGPSAYGDISVDPSLRASQSAQLAALENLRQSGGFNNTDKANLATIANQEASKEKAQRDAIMQQSQMRGNAGGGMALMAMLNANQAATNRMSQRGLDVAGMAQDRALKAGDSAANLSGNMQKQDFDRAAQVAGARDAVARFNAQMGNQGNQFNQQQNMQMQQANQQKQQGVYNQRAQADQSAQNMNRFTQPQAEYAAKRDKAQGMAGNAQNKAKFYNDQIAQGRTAQGQMWGGALQAGAGIYGDSLVAGAIKNGNAASGGAQGYGSTFKGSPGGNDYAAMESGNYDGYQPYKPGRSNYVEMAYGGEVPGEAGFYGDSPMNDTVDARLSPGEVVVPRSMTDERPEQIGEFVQNARDPRQAKLDALQRLRNGGMR